MDRITRELTIHTDQAVCTALCLGFCVPRLQVCEIPPPDLGSMLQSNA